MKILLILILLIGGCSKRIIHNESRSFSSYVIMNENGKVKEKSDKFEEFRNLDAESFPLIRLGIWNKAKEE